MELYILDSLLRRETVVDRFESLIWTERFQTIGDFELQIYSNIDSRNLFKEGAQVACNESHRVMTIETIEDTRDDEGRAILKIRGRSLEAILEDRIAGNRNALTTTTSKQTYTGTPVAIADKLFTDACVTYPFTSWDKIPFYTSGTFYPADTIPAPTESITHEIEVVNLYEALRDVCTAYDLGFRLVRQYDTSKLYFDVYTGNDRTARQTVLPAVIFSPELENLKNTTEFTTIEKSKNIAVVYGPANRVIVRPADVPEDVDGFDRRTMIVKVDSIPEGVTDVMAYLTTRGQEELAKSRGYMAFDGELRQDSSYKYGVHYEVGDLVTIRNENGWANDMRVTEQIFVSDREGDRAYPTLSVNMFVNPDSWLAQGITVHWEDKGLTEYWENA